MAMAANGVELAVVMAPCVYFEPPDDLLVGDYLVRRIRGQDLSLGAMIGEADPRSAPPWELLDNHQCKGNDAYFFAAGEAKSSKDTRQKRRCKGGGTWKIQKSSHQGVEMCWAGEKIVYHKNALNFHAEGESRSSGWVMHEFVVAAPLDVASSPIRVYRIRFSGHGSKRKREPEDYGGAAAAARAMPRRAPETYTASTPQSCCIVPPPPPQPRSALCPAAALHAPWPQSAPCPTTAPEPYIVPPPPPPPRSALCPAAALHALRPQSAPCPTTAPETYIVPPPQSCCVMPPPPPPSLRAPCSATALHVPPSQRPPCPAAAPERYLVPPAPSASSRIPQSSFLDALLPWNDMDELLPSNDDDNHLETMLEAEDDDVAQDDDEEAFADHLEKALAAAQDDDEEAFADHLENEETVANHLEKELVAAEDDEGMIQWNLEMPENIEEIMSCNMTEEVFRFMTEEDN